MLTVLLITVAAVVGAIIAAGVLAPTGGFALRVVGVIFAIALLIVGIALLWEHAIVALLIAALCALAVSVMFGQVDPSKAIGGTVAALLLVFGFTHLTLQLADPIFFDRSNHLSRWFAHVFEQDQLFGHDIADTPGSLVALGVALLVASVFLDRWLRAGVVFGGVLLVLSSTPTLTLLERSGIHLDNVFRSSNDPVFNLAVLCIVVIGAVGLLRSIMNSK